MMNKIKNKIKTFASLRGLLFVIFVAITIVVFFYSLKPAFVIRPDMKLVTGEMNLSDTHYYHEIENYQESILAVEIMAHQNNPNEASTLNLDILCDGQVVSTISNDLTTVPGKLSWTFEYDKPFKLEAGHNYSLDIYGNNVSAFMTGEDSSEVNLQITAEKSEIKNQVMPWCGFSIILIVALLFIFLDFSKFSISKAAISAVLINIFLLFVRYDFFERVGEWDLKYSLNHAAAIRVFLTVFFILAISAVVFFTSGVRNLAIEKQYLALAVPLVIIYMIIFMPWNQPDTDAHFLATYRWSNIVMGCDKDETWTGRSEDVAFSKYWTKANNPHIVEYRDLESEMHLKCGNSEIVDFPQKEEKMEYYSIFNYLPEVLGLTIGRLLNLSSFVSVYLGRIFIAAFYLFASYRAIKRAPIGKGIFTMIFLLPMCLMMSSAISYDSMVIIITMSFIANVLLLKTEYSKANLIETLIWIFLIGAVKGGGYLLLLPLVFILLDKKNIKKSAVWAGSIIASGLFSALLFDKLLAPPKQLFQFGDEGNGYMVASYALEKPMDFLNMCLTSYMRYPDELFINIGGAKLAWLDPTIPIFIIMCMFIVMILFAISEKDKIRLGNVEKYIFVVVVLISLLSTPAMLLSWTPIRSKLVEGLQGRYFLPIFPLIMFLISKFSLYRPIEKRDEALRIENKLLSTFALLSFVAVYYMLSLYLTR